MAKSPKFSQEYYVPPRGPEQAVFIPLSTWECIMRRIKKLKDNSPKLDSLGWGLIGVGAGALIAAISHPFSADFLLRASDGSKSANVSAIIVECAFLILGVSTVASGIVTLRYSKIHASDRADLNGLIIEDMEAFSKNASTPVGVAE